MVNDKTALVIGNGPSLANIPNSFLAKYPTFGSNRIYLKFVPDYYAFCDKLWLHHYIEDIKKLDCKLKFIHDNYADQIPDAIPLHDFPKRREFSYEPYEWICDGSTVTFVLLQWAYFLGFERVGLIGVDHHYPGYSGKAWDLQTGKESGHFAPDYYGDDVTYMKPALHSSVRSYGLARDAYEAAGWEVVNITPGSQLDVFKKEDWHGWDK
ncbi:MAG: hypothetical protein PHT43_06000 [Anaerolineaceae bacterium]|nr:hypothetical protein [Anaerolineaceae bacterium]